MTLRPLRISAIAARDLAQELRGRRGILFSVVTAALLIPAASIRIRVPSPDRLRPRVVYVTGDVPDPVVELPFVERTRRDAHLVFSEDPDGTLVVRGADIAPGIRRALDGDTPAVRIETEFPDWPMPGRTLLFALLSASILTGAVSESLGGERSRHTLQTLLSASVTRGEIVCGKWLAWGGYGALSALAAALLSVLLGRVSPGWWLLPLPTVAAGTVAFAMFLSRHATDVVGSASVSLRVLPAVISGSGVIAWFFSDTHPLLSAALPIGGALLAAGDTWPGPWPAIVSATSTLAACGVLLYLTARDLDTPAPPPQTLARRLRQTATISAIAACAWWVPITSPLLWGVAGNPDLTRTIPPEPGIVAGALALVLWSAIHAGNSTTPTRTLGLYAPSRGAWGLLLTAGVILSAITRSPAPALPSEELLIAAGHRLDLAVTPSHAGLSVLVLALVAQELVFRGWLRHRAGPFLASAAFVLVITPLDPLHGLLLASVLVTLTIAAGGSILPALLLRVLLPFLPSHSLPWPIALTLASVGVALWANTHRKTDRPLTFGKSP